MEQISRMRNDNESVGICDFAMNRLKNILEDGNQIVKGHIVEIVEGIEECEEMSVNNVGLYLMRKLYEQFGLNE